MDSSADSGVQPSVADASTPRRGGLLWCLHEAIAIARLDSDAIRRTARDGRALFYGALALCLTSAVVSLVRERPSGGGLDQLGGVARGVAFTLGLAFSIALQFCVSALRVAVIHGAARLFFGATGRYLSLLRVIWLGSVVQVFTIVPFIGVLIGGGWMLLIQLWTYEEVDGIERLQALIVVLGVGVLGLVVLGLFSWTV